MRLRPSESFLIRRLCDKLVLKKLIVRSSNKNNRRQILLRISDKGLTALEEINPYFVAVNEGLKGISSEKLEQISDILDEIRDSLR
jgi:MarR family transcriptional regulator for hemolysin